MDPKVISDLLGLFGRIFQRDTQICSKCAALRGEVFCDRSMLGESGACDFVPVPACRKCGSLVPCFGHPCELADRISEIRMSNSEYVRRATNK